MGWVRRPRGNHLGRAKGRGLDYVRREWGEGTEARERERERPKQDDRNKSENPLRLRWVGGGKRRGHLGARMWRGRGTRTQTHCVGSNYRADGGPGGSSLFQPYGVGGRHTETRGRGTGEQESGKMGKGKGSSHQDRAKISLNPLPPSSTHPRTPHFTSGSVQHRRQTKRDGSPGPSWK